MAICDSTRPTLTLQRDVLRITEGPAVFAFRRDGRKLRLV